MVEALLAAGRYALPVKAKIENKAEPPIDPGSGSGAGTDRH
jgi:hypothetical protein